MLMGPFASGLAMKIFSTLTSVVIIVINIFFVAEFVLEELPQTVLTYVGVGKSFLCTHPPQ